MNTITAINALTANALTAINALTANALTANALTANALTANALTANALTANSLTANALTANALTANALPIEIINKIINYTGVVTFYKGKYYNRIPKNDNRYTMLENIIKPPHIIEDSHFLNDNRSYSVIKISINLKKNIGESYNTPRFRLMYSTYKNNAGEFYKERLEVYRHGRSESYSEYYLLSKERKWVKTRDIMHQEHISFY